MTEERDDTPSSVAQGECLSALSDPYLAWLSHGLSLALANRIRTLNALFLKEELTEFMESLDQSDTLRNVRTQLLVKAKVHPKAAPRYSAAMAVEQIDLTRSAGLTSREDLTNCFTLDQFVTACPRLAWKMLDNPVEGVELANRFEEKTSTSDAERALLLKLVDEALETHCLTAHDIVSGIGLSTIYAHLPAEVHIRLIEAALEKGRAHEPFTDDDALAVVTLEKLCTNIPIADVWLCVLRPLLALPHGWIQPPEPPMQSSVAPPALFLPTPVIPPGEEPPPKSTTDPPESLSDSHPHWDAPAEPPPAVHDSLPPLLDVTEDDELSSATIAAIESDTAHELLAPESFRSEPPDSEDGLFYLPSPLASIPQVAAATEEGPLFPPLDLDAFPERDRENSAPSRERSDLIPAIKSVDRIEGAGFTIIGLTRLMAVEITDLEDVLVDGVWIEDEPRMRAVLIRVLAQDETGPKKTALERETTEGLAKRFNTWLSLHHPQRQPLPTESAEIHAEV